MNTVLAGQQCGDKSAHAQADYAHPLYIDTLYLLQPLPGQSSILHHTANGHILESAL
ncbi:unnamed protein product, partial [marine sediment metagenome]